MAKDLGSIGGGGVVHGIHAMNITAIKSSEEDELKPSEFLTVYDLVI